MSKLLKHTPKSIVQPFSTYSQGVEVPANARWLYVAGQVGVKADGEVAGGPKAQVDQAWKNVLAVLKSANMSMEDLAHSIREIKLARVRHAWSAGLTEEDLGYV